MSNDIPSWSTLTEYEKQLDDAGVHRPDAARHHPGHRRRGLSLIPDAVTPHEEAVLTNIAFMESVHAKSYSSIFSTQLHQEIDEAFPLVGGERTPAA